MRQSQKIPRIQIATQKIRNRRYKIKKLLAQPRNIDVKQNSRVVRRMIVRRKTIYPSARRRQNINWLKTICKH